MGTSAVLPGWLLRAGWSRSQPHTKRSILVIDDEPDFCAVVRELLRFYQIDVFPAHSVEEAVAVLKKVTPDLIMTDVLMPGSDGLSFLRRLRSDPAWRRIPTLVVSACAQHETRSAALEAGADAFLPKPFSIRDLRLAIERQLSK